MGGIKDFLETFQVMQIVRATLQEGCQGIEGVRRTPSSGQSNRGTR